MQASETIKLIIGLGDTLVGRLVLIDALRVRFETILVGKDPACPACGTREITALQDYDAMCGGAIASDGDVASDEITPLTLKHRLVAGDKLSIIDVREAYEWAIGRIEHARLIPLNALPQSVHSLDREDEIIVYCHHGGRSAAAVAWLQDQGFARVKNLVGGIDRWSLEVDTNVRRY
jgi:adenylyltransferase/sulfurtransferase